MSPKGLAVAVGVTVLCACGSSSSELPLAAVQNVYQYHYSVSWPIWNPCPPTPESVQFEGKIHQVVKVRPGELDVTWNLADVKGTGLTTANDYLLQDNIKQESVVMPPSGTSISQSRHFRVISKGAADNFDYVLDWVYSFPPYSFEIMKSRFQCRG